MQTDQTDDFRKIRQNHTVELRKQTREEIFLKRRNQFTKTSQSSIQVNTSKNTPVDQRFKEIIEKSFNEKFEISQLGTLVQGLSSNDPNYLHWAIIGVRMVLSSKSENEDMIQALIDSGIVPSLITMATQIQYPHIQKESCWILSNIASGTSAQCESIVSKGGIQVFLSILKEKRTWAYEQAIWGVGNISGDCAKMRDQILMKGGINILVSIAEQTQNKILIQSCAWALSNLCRHQPKPKYKTIEPAITVLARMIVAAQLATSDLGDCLWALANNTQSQKSKIQKIVQVPDFVKKLIQICRQNYQNKSVIVPALRIVGNISVGNELHTQQLLKNQILDLIPMMLGHHLKGLRRQTCWIISNLAAGTVSQVNQLLARQNIFQQINRMFKEEDMQIRKQVMYIFLNLGKKLEPIKAYQIFVSCHYVDGLISMIYHQEDPKIIETSLHGLFQALQIGSKISEPNPILKYLQQVPGLLQKLESLQYHKSQQIYIKIRLIFQNFFTIESNPS